MKSNVGFWHSLEIYAWRVARRNPLPYPYLIIGIMVLVIMMSLLGKSLASATTIEGAIRKAAVNGDYGLARQLLTNQQTNGASNNLVLGANTELEGLVYPERVVEKRIVELEEKLSEYPGNREIYLSLAKLYEQIGKIEESERYGEKARILDPNN